MVADDDAGTSDPSPKDAGPWVPPDPGCGDDGRWLLAPGFLPAKRVDYIADREIAFEEGTGPDGTGAVGGSAAGGVVPVVRVISSAGMPCANARNRDACEKGLKLPTSVGRHLVTTAGDTVKIWTFPGVLQLLGAIDTASEAMWVLTATRMEPSCKATIGHDDDGFIVSGLPNFGCATMIDGGPVANASSRVRANAEVSDIVVDGGLGPCPPIEVPDAAVQPDPVP